MAISADPPEDSAEFIAEDEITVPLLSDPGLVAISAYGVAMDGNDIAVPAVFVVKQDRTIVWSYVGENMADRPDSAGLLEAAKRAR